MKFNNKVLGIIFIVLIAIFIISKTINKPQERSIKETLVAIDTSKVTKIILTKGQAQRIELKKQQEKWTVSEDHRSAPATDNSINSILSAITQIKPQQLISKNKDKWANYELDDDSGKKIEVYSGNKLLDAFYAGRFNFNQQNRTAKTYFRKANEDEVYSVDGFLSMTFDKKMNDFRNKKIFDGLQKNQIKGISYNTNIDNQQLTFATNQWINQNNESKDSLKVEQYINQLVNLVGSDIDDTFTAAENSQFGSIKLINENNTTLGELSIYNDLGKDKPFVFHSSLNEGIYFRSDSLGLYNTIVTGIEELSL